MLLLSASSNGVLACGVSGVSLGVQGGGLGVAGVSLGVLLTKASAAGGS